jgi:molecular chaperone Hsp33
MTLAAHARPAGDDAIRPFHVDALDIRGRAIQMGPVLDAILSRHHYPAPVARVLGEAIVLAVLLGSSLKSGARFTLQTKTDGPIGMLVVDYRASGDIRACASFATEAVEAAEAQSGGALLGKGVLAMTIDPGPPMSRYQGVVPLHGDGLEVVAHEYFRQSEQIPTKVRLAVAEMHVRADGGLRRSWRAGGLIAQFLPEAPERIKPRDLPGGDGATAADASEQPDDDAWVEARSLVATVEDHELLDPDVPVDRLLYRLFHERGVRVFDARPVAANCSCSRERVEGILRQFSAEEIAESIEDGEITVTCEFCGTRYGFDPVGFAH